MPRRKTATTSTRSELMAWDRAIMYHPLLLDDLQTCRMASRLYQERERELWATVESLWRSLRGAVLQELPPYIEQDENYYREMGQLLPDAAIEDLHAFHTAHTQFHRCRLCRPAIQVWIKQRYRNTWQRAPYMPEAILDGAIAEAIWHGEWYGVGHSGPFTRPVLVDVFAEAECVGPPWSRIPDVVYSDYVEPPRRQPHGDRGFVQITIATRPVRPHPAIVLHVHDGAELSDAIEAVRKQWPRVEPFIGKKIGGRPRSRPKDYYFDVRLYRTWIEWTRRHHKGVKTFVRSYGLDEAQGGWIDADWGLDEEDRWDALTPASTITKRLTAARRWLDPIKDVPETLDVYLDAVGGN